MTWHGRAWAAGWDAGAGSGMLIAVAVLHFLPNLHVMTRELVEMGALGAGVTLFALGVGRSIYYELQARTE